MREKKVRRFAALDKDAIVDSDSEGNEPVADRHEAQMEGQNLNILLQDLEKRIRGILGEHIQLSLNLGDSPEGIEVDPGQVEWVIMNLVANARSGMRDGGNMTITTTNVLRIGRGPCADNPFEPSMRRHARVSFRYLQNGAPQERDFPMSLSIMNDILGKKGGEIWVGSGQEREAVIHVFLPALSKGLDEQESEEFEKKVIKDARWWQRLLPR